MFNTQRHPLAMDVVRAAVECSGGCAVMTHSEAGTKAYSYGDILLASDAYAKRAEAELRRLSRSSASECPAVGEAKRRKTPTLPRPSVMRRGNDPPGDGWTSVAGHRIAVMASPGAEYVAAMFAVWRMGCIAVPLALAHPKAELEYALEEADVALAVSTSEFSTKMRDAVCAAAEATGSARGFVELPDLSDIVEGAGRAPLGDQMVTPSGAASLGPDGVKAKPNERRRLVSSDVLAIQTPPIEPEDGALIIFTSGTTGRPKAALHTHGSLRAQVACLVDAWKWTRDDVIYHCLPLHHVHGIVNAWLCAHFAGAVVVFSHRFSPTLAWRWLVKSRFANKLFMGVPTMYVRLIQAYDRMKEEEEGDEELSKVKCRAAAAALRLAVSGSAACPVPVMTRWKEMTGQTLLERYGMTEIGMALSNPYYPMDARQPGKVGTPLPGVVAKVVPAADRPTAHPEDSPTATSADGEREGELRVKGPNLFRGYFGRPEVTAACFDDEGFFCTGDTVARETDGSYRVLGRTSVDIIKMAGYKLSALEIEGRLLEHEGIGEVAVVGVPDPVYGEVCGAVVAAAAGAEAPTLDALRAWAKDRLAPYKLPTLMRVVDSIPRNAMGKMNKKELVKLFTQSTS